MTQKKQIEKPLNRETIIIESFDGELLVLIQSEKTIKSLTLQFPDNPPRASQIKIHSEQDIKNINAIGSFNEPFNTLKAGNIGLVYCPVGKEYLITGKNEITATKPKFAWVKSILTILLLVAALGIVLYLNIHH